MQPQQAAHAGTAHTPLYHPHTPLPSLPHTQVLIFQEDALLCGPMIDDRTIGIDYVGAPWDPTDAWVAGKAWLCAIGGNGGLSYRRRSQAMRCLDMGCWQAGQWEDAYFVEKLQMLGHVVARSEDARLFAIERPLDVKDEEDAQPCGLHKAYNYLPPKLLESILRRLEKVYDWIVFDGMLAGGKVVVETC